MMLSSTSQNVAGRQAQRKAQRMQPAAAVHTGIQYRRAGRSSAAHVKPFGASKRPVHTQATTTTTGTPSLQQIGTSMISAAFDRNSAAAPVAVIGAQGAAGILLAKALLEAGFKVTAGVDYSEQAQATLKFVKKYELLSRAQLANLKLAEADDPLPKGARVIVFDQDVLGDKKTDARFVDDAVNRAKQAGASQVILISNVQATSGGFFSFGPSPNTPNKSLSRAEQVVAGSGLPFTVLRASLSDGAPEEAGVKVGAGPGALAPAAAPVSNNTLTQVLAAVLGQPAPVAGLPVVLEVVGTPAGEAAPLAAAIRDAVDEIREKTPEPIVPVKSAARAGSPNPFALGTISIKRSSPPLDEEEEQPKQKIVRAPPKPKAALSRTSPAIGASSSEEDEGSGPAGWLNGLFGAGSSTMRLKSGDDSKKAVPAPAGRAARASPPPKPAPVKPAPAAIRAGTTGVKAGTTSVAKPNPFSTVKRNRTASPEPEVEVEKKQDNGLFGFFAVTPQAAAPKEPSPAPSRPAARQAPKPAPKPAPAPAKPSPVARGRQASPEPAPASKPASSGGLFGGLFGFGAKSVDADEEELVKAPTRSGTAARKVATPPPKPAPARPTPAKAASAPAPKPASNSFSTVKRSTSTSAPASSTTKTTPAKQTPPARSQPAQKQGTQQVQKPASNAPGVPKGTYRPVSGYSITPKK